MHYLLTSGEQQTPEVAVHGSQLGKEKENPFDGQSNYPSSPEEHDYNILASSVA